MPRSTRDVSRLCGASRRMIECAGSRCAPARVTLESAYAPGLAARSRRLMKAGLGGHQLTDKVGRQERGS